MSYHEKFKLADQELQIDVETEEQRDALRRVMPCVVEAIEKRANDEMRRRVDVIRNQVMYEMNPEVRQLMEQMGFDADKMEDPEDFARAMRKVLELTYDDDYDDPVLTYDLSDRPHRAPYINIDYTVDEEVARSVYEEDMEKYRSLHLLGVTYEQWLEHKKRVALNRELNG